MCTSCIVYSYVTCLPFFTNKFAAYLLPDSPKGLSYSNVVRLNGQLPLRGFVFIIRPRGGNPRLRFYYTTTWGNKKPMFRELTKMLRQKKSESGKKEAWSMDTEFSSASKPIVPSKPGKPEYEKEKGKSFSLTVSSFRQTNRTLQIGEWVFRSFF